MRVLVTWGPDRGAMEEVARILGEALRLEGLWVELLPPKPAERAVGFDAAVVGGTLHGTRWDRAARRFVVHREDDLRRVPVWFFSGGPLDDSARRPAVTKRLEALMARVGAQGHIAFCGPLAQQADRVRAWASDIARALPDARPAGAVARARRSVSRLLLHALAGWVLCAATMGGLLATNPLRTALAAHAVLAPLLFAAVASSYFGRTGSFSPLSTAVSFLVVAGALDLSVVAGLVQGSFTGFAGVAGAWLPLALVFFSTWMTGALLTHRPAPVPSALSLPLAPRLVRSTASAPSRSGRGRRAEDEV